MSTKYALLSLPLGVFDSSDREEAISSLRGTISSDNGSVLPFSIPDFKIGTLDALVQQADDLAKLEASCQAVVAKVGDSLKNVLEGDEDRIAQYKMVNDKPTDQYLSTFSWNRIRYRADKSLGELISTLQKELATVDNDVKTKFNQYNSVKTNLATLQRRQTGNLSTKSLTPIVDPSLLIQDSEYIETHLIVVPANSKKDFIKSYETLAPMVVPRSSVQVAQDEEFVLFAVATFKKHSAEFLAKCREQKWTPRQYKHVQGGREEEQRELDRVTNEERKVCGEALRMGRTGWSESVMIWVHVLTLRVFVEAVLRYGLPLDYVTALVKTTTKLAPKVKTALDSNYSYLGGNAFGRDKRGKITKDDAALSSEMAAAGFQTGEGHEYTAYVYYEVEFP
ncbi:Vacuolar ATP synthase subunit C [Fusarium falciforme]|uniref:V-type proton ATPase subunit C n=2 Tax=Fusarium solani species complex TaxID=232080 RepID=A0A9W8V7A3_9HYPO|nr:V-type proton ATPase subunit C [Fusarium keratoplasticum]XP_053002148.1 V-type proton ATPase subunit C [Fusarium falciforme]KAI8683857.1 V-type proton ATPase subunit C [Fusarium keratoplasticum]KAI8687970.1 V-type proton ATPase subunit C [Fusarium keratoplasticum]KAJ4173416.1 Vacuolar ATP synthase subunit C [Fusarium falciforme]KAJ4196425.1 Vacuolar ATP synthase subunit C [Fusarium falciforme]KAJ4203685.1 Vacuolar ATP synthase subunit C [Fusarium falciforme]